MTPQTKAASLPHVSVVVIGLNVEPFLNAALTAIRASNYPQDRLEIIYVDSGSHDRSLAIAKAHKCVTTITLEDAKPNAAKGRHAGFLHATHDLIQFVDADTYLHPQWLRSAVNAMAPDVGAVAGSLFERFPGKNWFHKMANLEWNLRMGDSGWSTQVQDARTFGGNVLLRRHVYLQAGGYDLSLSAGEDPDLSTRVRHAGYRILRSNALMGSHDINLNSWRQFLRRTRRSGQAYMALTLKYLNHSERVMLKRVLRILAGVFLAPSILAVSAMLGNFWVGVPLALLVQFRLLFQIPKYKRLFHSDTRTATLYAFYLILSVYPQAVGVLESGWKALKHQGIRSLIPWPTLQPTRIFQKG